MEKDSVKSRKDIIIGRRPVSEALRSGREMESIVVLNGKLSGSVIPIISKAKEKGIPVKQVGKSKLDSICDGANHQGIIAKVSLKKYSSIEEILQIAEQRGEPPFIIIADGLEDPHNLGAIIRTAECSGVHGIVIPSRRSVQVTYAVDKVSAGALQYMKVARVNNIVRAIEKLKKSGVWVFGADMAGESIYDFDLKQALAIVIGNENSGISRLVKENCDALISLPLRGNIQSLNASVAAGVIMFEVLRKRS